MISKTSSLADRAQRLYSDGYQPSVEEFRELCSQTITKEMYPMCSDVISNVPIYHTEKLRMDAGDIQESLMDEFYDILIRTSGVFVLRGMYNSMELLDQCNQAYQSIIDEERASTRGDHFSTEGNNDRIWNSFEKHVARDPISFYNYYSNPWMSIVSRAWLGPGYRITAQVNVVKPAGAAQMPHRDYHLGFQDLEGCARIPTSMHKASQHLTLQGAVAHSDMPLDSGPTRLLPFSQAFDAGFIAYRLPQFVVFFAKHHVALPLKKGDAIFFNPALFHAAGANVTESFHRKANLIQVSSPFGKPMEHVRTWLIIERCWPHLQHQYAMEGLSPEVSAFIAAVGEGYPFPTNLDARPPGPNGMAPESEQDLLKRALSEGWNVKKLREELAIVRQA